MKHMISVSFRILYEVIGRHLPKTYTPFVGWFGKMIRRFLARGFVASMGRDVVIEKNATIPFSLHIGDCSGIGINALIEPEVSIGDFVMVGPDVCIYTQNHSHILCDIPFCKQGYETRLPVKIGNNVWIGTRSIILPGVEIGDNVVIGAGSVVTKAVPTGVLAAGAPAKALKEL